MIISRIPPANIQAQTKSEYFDYLGCIQSAKTARSEFRASQVNHPFVTTNTRQVLPMRPMLRSTDFRAANETERAPGWVIATFGVGYLAVMAFGIWLCTHNGFAFLRGIWA